MFKKLDHLLLTVKKPFVWPLRLILLLFAVYVAVYIYEILSTGIAEYRNIVDSLRGEDPYGYWSKFLEKVAMGLFFVLLAIQVKEQKG